MRLRVSRRLRRKWWVYSNFTEKIKLSVLHQIPGNVFQVTHGFEVLHFLGNLSWEKGTSLFLKFVVMGVLQILGKVLQYTGGSVDHLI